jgi:hypothetical protein
MSETLKKLLTETLTTVSSDELETLICDTRIVRWIAVNLLLDRESQTVGELVTIYRAERSGDGDFQFRKEAAKRIVAYYSRVPPAQRTALHDQAIEDLSDVIDHAVYTDLKDEAWRCYAEWNPTQRQLAEFICGNPSHKPLHAQALELYLRTNPDPNGDEFGEVTRNMPNSERQFAEYRSTFAS